MFNTPEHRSLKMHLPGQWKLVMIYLRTSGHGRDLFRSSAMNIITQWKRQRMEYLPMQGLKERLLPEASIFT